MKKKMILSVCLIMAILLAGFTATKAFASIATPEIRERKSMGNDVAITPTPILDSDTVITQEEFSEIESYTSIVDGDELTVFVYKGEAAKNFTIPDELNLIESNTTYAEPTELSMTSTSYEERVLSSAYVYTRNGVLVATVIDTCTVWYYTDNKVHLYSRSLSLSAASGYSSSYVTYGSIVNTDGSVSYTSGDSCTLIAILYNVTNSINFIVTPTSYSFY